METDQELLDRYQRVRAELLRVWQTMERLPVGSPTRAKRAKWGGSLQFTLLQIEEEMRERGLHA